MAAKLKVAILITSLLVTGCSAPWSSGSSTTTPVATRLATAVPTPVAPAPTSTRPDISPSPSPSPTPILPSPTPTTVPTPTLLPTPVVKAGPVANCCGVFSWIDDRHLLVFDTPANGKQGTYVVDVTTGDRQFISPVFGLPSRSGLIAFSDSTRGVTEVRRTDGTLVSTIQNGGVLTWISPDGTRLVWLKDLGVPNTSSLVNRVVQLTVSAIDGSDVRPLVRFEASGVLWTADSRHVVALARAPGGSQSGIWSIDTNDGTNAVSVPVTYVRALKVSPDGTRMSYLVTFSGDSSNNGIWVANVDGTNAMHLSDVGAIRWAGDDRHLWLLSLAAAGGGQDHLVKIDVTSDALGSPVPLSGRVLNGQWEVSPDGKIVALWSESDKSVLLRPLSP